MCRVWIWCDSVRDHNVPHHTRIDFVLPKVSPVREVAHRSGRISFTASSQSLNSGSLWSWGFLAAMSSLGDCLRGNTGARLTLQDMTSPSTWSAFTSPACPWPEGFFCHCSCCGVRCWTVAGRGWPPVRLGAWALWLWGCEHTNHWEVFTYPFECCNKV